MGGSEKILKIEGRIAAACLHDDEVFLELADEGVEDFVGDVELEGSFLVVYCHCVILFFQVLDHHFLDLLLHFLLVEGAAVRVGKGFIIEVQVHSAQRYNLFLDFFLDLHEDDVEGFFGDIIMGHAWVDARVPKLMLQGKGSPSLE